MWTRGCVTYTRLVGPRSRLAEENLRKMIFCRPCDQDPCASIKVGGMAQPVMEKRKKEVLPGPKNIKQKNC